MLSGPPRRRRARPVADAPIDALLDRAEDLTKGWLLALLERAPLDDAPRILAADLTREGPRVCAAILRALADETDHRRLEPGGALAPLAARVGELAGATGAASTSLAVDALHGVVWAALRAELPDPDPELISELAERLSQVIELIRVAALTYGEAPGSGPGAGAAPSPALTAVEARVEPAAEASPPPESAAVQTSPPEPTAAETPSPVAAAAETSPPVPAAAETPSPVPAAAEPSPPVPAAAEPFPPEPGAAEPSLLEPASGMTSPPPWVWGATEPAAPGPESLWVEALQEEITRTGATPLSLLLAELEDADRVLTVETEAGAAGTFGAFARAVRGVVRRQDILVCETESRAWIIARDTGRGGAQALGSRITSAVRAGEPWRGAPLAASVGISVLGEDGRTPAELIEAAEEARFAAAASGVDVLHAVREDPRGDD
jgi:GGDEF domain-containing protein